MAIVRKKRSIDYRCYNTSKLRGGWCKLLELILNQCAAVTPSYSLLNHFISIKGIGFNGNSVCKFSIF